MSAPACIWIDSSSVPSTTAVPSSEPPCVDEPLQYFGPDHATMEPAPVALPASSTVTISPLLSLASDAAAVTCPAHPCAESNSASLGPASAPTAPALSPAHLDSDPLLGS